MRGVLAKGWLFLTTCLTRRPATFAAARPQMHKIPGDVREILTSDKLGSPGLTEGLKYAWSDQPISAKLSA